MDDKELQEQVELFVNERLGKYFKSNRANKTRVWELFEHWKPIIEKRIPEQSKQFQEYLDEIAELEGNEQENIYRFGFRDGARVLLEILFL